MDDFDLPRPDAALPRDPLPRPVFAQPSAGTEKVADFNEFYRGFVPILVVSSCGRVRTLLTPPILPKKQ